MSSNCFNLYHAPYKPSSLHFGAADIRKINHLLRRRSFIHRNQKSSLFSGFMVLLCCWLKLRPRAQTATKEEPSAAGGRCARARNALFLAL